MFVYYNMKNKIKVIRNKHFKLSTLLEEDIKGFKIILKHINHPHSSIVIDYPNDGYIISNNKTHFHLLFSYDNIQLINTKVYTILHMQSIVKDRIFKIIKKKLQIERTELKKVILDKKLSILDGILTKIK